MAGQFGAMELSGVGCALRTASVWSNEFKLPGSSASLFSRGAADIPAPLSPVRWNSSRQSKGCGTTVCKVKRGRRPVGKSNGERQKEFAIRKEELLRKSRGEVSVATVSSVGGESNVESFGALLLVNADGGAVSVSALQPIDEEYHPVENLSARERSGLSSSSNGSPSQSLSNISLLNGFSKLVVQNASRGSGKESASAQTLNSEGLVSRRVVKNGDCTATSIVEHTVTRNVDWQKEEFVSRAADGSSYSDVEEVFDEEWEEVGVDDEDEEEGEDEAEYWEGDLPPMTAEEEELLLQEAEKELAELEKLSVFGKDPEKELIASEIPVDSERAGKERKLADLKALVQKMEEDLADEESNAELNSESVRGLSTGFDKEGGQGSDEWEEEGFETLDEEERKEPSPSGEAHLETRRVNGHRRHRQDYWELDGEDEDEGEDKENVKEYRGVPAVMRCFDRAKIYVKAGDGGNGVVAFRREKFVPFGGPFGGNGGRGGQVYVEADSSMNSLLPFRKSVHYRAVRGAHGGGKRKEGAVGTDITVKVPPGTLIREAGPEGKVLLELIKPGQRELLLPGGAGGRGNAAFKTGRNNAPQLAELGEQGPEMWIELELKLVADVGIVGVPNAGKSTLLSAVSAAKPEIANYPFTTLLPNLGVVALDYDATMVVADLPGLLEGAHTGIGLGHEFLRHTERCRVLVHVIDGMSSQPVEEFEAVRLELQLFNPILSEKPFVVAYNKMDIPEAFERWNDFQRSLQSKGLEPFCMSAATGQGSREVMSAGHALLKEQKETDFEDDSEEEPKTMSVAEMVRKQRSAAIENFTIQEDKHTRTWQVIGAGLERFTQMTNWEYFESMRRFQRVLSASGVNKALRERGIREGDLVIVNQMEFNWVDSEDMSKLADWKRGVRGSKVWPH